MCIRIFDVLALVYAWLLGIRYTTWYFDGEHSPAKVIHVHRAPWPGMAAMTIGNTVIYNGTKVPNATIRHELVHVRQWHKHGCWFPILYLWASIKSLIRHGNLYLDNDFEVEARRAE